MADRPVTRNRSSDTARKSRQSGQRKRSGPAHGYARRAPERTMRDDGSVWLYGDHACIAALRNPRRAIHRIIATTKSTDVIAPYAEQRGLRIDQCQTQDIDQVLGPGAAHQGIAMLAGPLPDVPVELFAQKGRDENGLVVVVDSVSDPHNLGAIMRSALAFGALGVVVPQRGSAALNGATAKAATGALERVPVAQVVNLVRALEALKASGYWIVGLDGEGGQDFANVPKDCPIALVLGAEGSGMRRLVAEQCDLTVRIPIAKSVESLNVSVAAGIALYQLATFRV